MSVLPLKVQGNVSGFKYLVKVSSEPYKQITFAQCDWELGMVSK